jgi:probable rRNA maturation factor
MQTLELHNLSVSIQNGMLPEVPFLAIKEKVLGKKYELSIAFVTPKQAQNINIERRNKDYIPNTLSFELTKSSGEIILCMSVLKKQHKEWGMDLHTYITYILIHSMLHLKGMLHGDIMERKEQQLLAHFAATSTPHATHHHLRH